MDEFCKYRYNKDLTLNNITKDQITPNHIGKDQNFTPNPTLKLLEDQTNQQILKQLKTAFTKEQNTYQQNKTKTLNLEGLDKGFER